MGSLQVICIVCSLIASLILPLAFAVAYALRHKKQGIWSAWLLGAAGFFVPQMLIRIPILNMLGTNAGFLAFTQAHPVLYILALAFTAGLFELAGRLAATLLLRKNLTYRRSLAAGLGHGGIEAILLAGVTCISNLVLFFLIQSVGFDALVAQTAAAGGDVSYLETIPGAFAATSPATFLLSGFERLLTMACHAAMSVIVCYSVYRKRILTGALVCLGMHTCIDCVAGINLLVGKGLSQTGAYCIIYILLTAAAAAAVVILKTIHSRWDREQEVSYAPQE